MPGPWEGVFEDTALSSLDFNAGNGLFSRTKIYRDLEENETGFSRMLRIQNGFWVRPKVYTKCENIGDSREEIKEIDASLLLGKDLGRSASALFLLQPQRTLVEHAFSSFGPSVADQGDGGVGLLIRPFPRTVLMGMGKGTYWSKVDSARVSDRGWGSEFAGQTTFSPPVLDSISFAGELRNEEREIGQHFFSNLRITGFKSFDSVTTARIALRQGGGFTRDQSSRVDEKNRSMSAAGMIGYAPGKIAVKLYGDRTHEEKPPARNIVFDGWQGAGSFEIQGERGSIGVAGGVGGSIEDNALNFSSGHHDRIFWLDGGARLESGEGVWLEWRGHGKMTAADYPAITAEGDSLRDRLDNDNVSVEHWGGLTWVTASACTLVFQGRYSEDMSQYLLSSQSESNRIYEVFSLSPSVSWRLGSLLHNSEVLDLTAIYTRSPFVVSSNNLYRQLRAGSVTTCFLGSFDRAILTTGFLQSDQGQLDSLNVYEVGKKQFRYDWLLEWSRTMFGGIEGRPGFGMTYNRKTIFDISTRTYVPSPMPSTRTYSLRVQRAEGRLTLSARTMFIQDGTGQGYWDGSVIAQGGF